MQKRLVVGISGASGAILGVRLLELLKRLEVETHLVVTEWGKKTIEAETDYSLHYVKKLAFRYYDNRELSAAISSGSFYTSGMVVIPCSMKTLAGIATGYSDSLILRAADVTLKEKRELILVPRETPLNAIHLENMLALSRAGATIMPFMPAFYNKPGCLEHVIDQFLYRVIRMLKIEGGDLREWQGL